MNKKNDNLLLFSILGKPGSGKDTQAKLLEEHFNLHNIKTSTLINKKFEESNSPTIQEHKKVFEEGGLLDSSFVVSILQEHIEKLFKNEEMSGGIVFGGSPRKLIEAKALMAMAEEYFKQENIFCIHLDIPDELGIERILKRDARPLDRDRNVLKFRMEEFYESTMPVIHFFKNRGMIYKIDGRKSPEEVFEITKEYLANKIQK